MEKEAAPTVGIVVPEITVVTGAIPAVTTVGVTWTKNLSAPVKLVKVLMALTAVTIFMGARAIMAAKDRAVIALRFHFPLAQ
jgi:hypothetical protein